MALTGLTTKPLQSHPYLAYLPIRRRPALVALLIAVALARSAPLVHSKELAETVSFKSWRDEWRARREERKRRERETPLRVTFVHDAVVLTLSQQYSRIGEEDGGLGKSASYGVILPFVVHPASVWISNIVGPSYGSTFESAHHAYPTSAIC